MRFAHWGCADTVRESALKVDSGRKIPCRTEESNLRRRRAGPMLNHLNYIPNPDFDIIVGQRLVSDENSENSACWIPEVRHKRLSDGDVKALSHFQTQS